MTYETVTRLGLLYAHLILSAFAICYVISADLQILRGAISRTSLRQTGRRMTVLLAGLWMTGLPIILIDLGGDAGLLLVKGKLLAKVLCVVALSLNAVVLHYYAFPRLMSGRSLSNTEWSLVMSFGAVSTTTWLFAAFLGVAKPLTNVLTFQQFMGLYAAIVTAGIAASLLLARPLRRRLHGDMAAVMAV